MCLTTEAFALFLTILGSDIVTADTTRVTVHATSGDVAWHAVVDEWCTAAPFAGQRQFLVRANPETPARPRP